MSDTAVAEQVTLTREEYEILRAGQPATVTITAEEYRDLKAKAAAGVGCVDPAVHQRCVGRMNELEMLMRREQTDHAEEVATMTAALRKYVNPQQ